MQVVLDFVCGVHGDPPKGPRRRLWKAVRDLTPPIGALEPPQEPDEQYRRLLDLDRDIACVLLVVAVVLDALVTTHRPRLMTETPQNHQHSLTLNEQDVAHMARVLKLRPPH